MHTFKSDLFLFGAGIFAAAPVLNVDAIGLVDKVRALFA